MRTGTGPLNVGMWLTRCTFAVPAVRNFAIYAAVAVLLNALLQITVFVAAMAIDLRRVESNRIDWCVLHQSSVARRTS